MNSAYQFVIKVDGVVAGYVSEGEGAKAKADRLAGVLRMGCDNPDSITVEELQSSPSCIVDRVVPQGHRNLDA